MGISNLSEPVLLELGQAKADLNSKRSDGNAPAHSAAEGILSQVLLRVRDFGKRPCEKTWPSNTKALVVLLSHFAFFFL